MVVVEPWVQDSTEKFELYRHQLEGRRENNPALEKCHSTGEFQWFCWCGLLILGKWGPESVLYISRLGDGSLWPCGSCRGNIVEISFLFPPPSYMIPSQFQCLHEEYVFCFPGPGIVCDTVEICRMTGCPF